MVEFTGFSEIADKFGFVVVFPNGSGTGSRSRSWNAGNINVHAARHNIDDIGFVNRLLDDLIPELQVDAQRVYSTGISNGGLFSYRLAAEASWRIAAASAVGCALIDFDLSPSRPVPIIHFHGTDDTYVPYLGGSCQRNLAANEFESVPDTVAFWAKQNGCQFPAKQDALPDAGDGTRIRLDTYTGGNQGSEVQLYTIDGGGHTWPGRPSQHTFLGRTTMQIDATELMWRFFHRFHRSA
jgi:polyhydroxybutyrate depolymerase